MLRGLSFIVGLALVILGAFFWAAGRSQPPIVHIRQPASVVGRAGTFEVEADAPGGRFTTLTVTFDQNGRTMPLFSLNAPGQATFVHDAPNRVRITGPLTPESVPGLAAGKARLNATAARSVMLGLRQKTAADSRDVTVSLEPPKVFVVSTHTYVNHGGAEMVVYRVTPPDVRSGVRVGTIEYRGYPASGAGIPGADPALHVAFFALLHEQPLDTPIVVFGQDTAGNQARASFVDNVFEKPMKHSRIELDDRFIERAVPEILEHTPELKTAVPSDGDMLPPFLKINGELRRIDSAKIAAYAKQSAPTRLWNGPFVQLGNSKVEASFADQRTYFYRGKEVDQQVHLGFDLAVTAGVPVVAANDGVVVHASYLGIFGNCIIIDHGLGVQSLYGHLSAFSVKVGDQVTKGQVIAHSGMTGLAEGDHLHFTMLVGGNPVNPVEWWDRHWIADRIERKLKEAGAVEPATAR